MMSSSGEQECTAASVQAVQEPKARLPPDI
jgi:hypothetical protein